MASALIVKTYGDPEMCHAIVSGMSGATAVVQSAELEEIRHEIEQLRMENEQLRTENGVHAYGHSERLKRALRSMEIRYRVVPTNPVLWAFLGVWGLLWTLIYGALDWVDSMTREQ